MNSNSNFLRIKLFFLLSIILVVNLCFGITNLIIFYTFFVPGWAYPSLLIFVNLSCILTFFISGFHLIHYTYRTKDVLKLTFEFSIYFLLFVLSYWFSIDSDKYYRVHILLFFFLFSISVFLILELFIYILRKKVDDSQMKNIIILGKNSYSDYLAQTLKENKWYGLNPFIINAKEELESNIHVKKIKEVIINAQIITIDDAFYDYLKYLKEERLIDITLFHEYFSKSLSRNVSSFIHDIPIVSLFTYPLDRYLNRTLKRFSDIIISLLVIILIGSWLFPIIAILLFIDNPGPIFYRQKRHGFNNKIFECLKFRSMKVQKNDEFIQARKGDDRITSFGKIIRKTSIDELPQILNVLLGDMSIVGPRPHPIDLNTSFSAKIDKYYSRHLYKPGITGLAQIKGYRGETDTLEKMQNRVKYDRYYIQNWTFLFDIKIIFLTVYNMLKGEKNAY